MTAGTLTTWRTVRFGLLVTGKGEERFGDRLFRALTQHENAVSVFKVIARVGQRAPIKSPKRLEVTGKRKSLASNDEQIGLHVLAFLKAYHDGYVVLLDDLEREGVPHITSKFQRYRDIFDKVLPNHLKHRGAVHFFVNMLEAYYFADSQAINEVLSTDFTDFDGDVETISHPKNKLKEMIRGFDEINHGKEIVNRLNLEHILSRPDTCASLRTLVAWCMKAAGQPFGERFRLLNGRYFEVTRPQIDALP